MTTLECPIITYDEANLRAIFSQITAEIRKKGLVLNEEDGSFYCSKRFSWKSTVKEFFDAYHKICERKQVPPIYQESKLTTALKVPYASIETINLFHGGVVKRLMQFKEQRIPPFSKLPYNPSREDLGAIRKLSGGDKDFCRFIDLVLIIDEELRQYSSLLSELSKAYNDRVEAFLMALKDRKSEKEAKRLFDKSGATISNILTPYIKKLNKAGVIPASWKYRLGLLPLTDRAKSRLGSTIVPLANIEDFWAKNALPTKKATDAYERKKIKTRAKYHREDERRLRRAKMELSRPSLWYRYDKWVTGIGNWFADKMDDITDGIMGVWVWFMVAFIIIGLIVVWIDEGFFTFLLAVFILLVIIGILAAVLDTIIAVIAMAVKYISYVPLIILRCIFYRGWTFLLFLLGGCGYLTYLILKAKYLI